MRESPRRKARIVVLKALYACEVPDNIPDDIIGTIIEDSKLAPKNIEFARNFFQLVRRHEKWADDIISKLVRNWDIKRIAELDLIILRMAMVELKYIPDIPAKVALNEAIELAKKFSTGESPSFINGVLDNFLKKLDTF